MKDDSVWPQRSTQQGTGGGPAPYRAPPSQMGYPPIRDTQPPAGEGPPSGSAMGVGKQIGPYLLTKRLGKGAMGAVYLVEHCQTRELSAMKVILPEALDDEATLKRFDIEFKAMHRLGDHPGIVSAHDWGETPGGLPYYCMEFVEGWSLKAARHEGLSEERVLDAVEQVARALAHAHGMGFVHRDVKPENVMITPEGRAMLTDFGIARVLGSFDKLTQTGDLLGTPIYMAPEQADKKLGEPGAWTDVFALGAILYEALCGRTPYIGKSVIGIYTKLLTGESFPRPRDLRPTLRPEYEELIMGALARKPEKRYPHAGVFAEKLRVLREQGPPDQAATAGLDPRKAALGLGALLTVLLVLVGAIIVDETGDEPTDTPSEVEVVDGNPLGEQQRRFEAGGSAEEIIGEVRALLADPERLAAEDIPAAQELLLAATRRFTSECVAKYAFSEPAQYLKEWEERFLPAALVLARDGDARRALDCCPRDAPAETRVRIAALTGQRATVESFLALFPDGDPQERALRWELSADFPRLRPGASDLASPGDALVRPVGAGWAALAQGEEALRRGILPLAELAYARVQQAAAPRSRFQHEAELGLARVALARGEGEAAYRHLGAAWAFLRSGPPEEVALLASRCLTLACELFLWPDLEGQPLLSAMNDLSNIDQALEERAAGLPAWMRALGRRELARWFAEEFGNEGARGPGLTARSLLQESRQHLGLSETARSVEALGPLAQGRDGSAGLFLARACRWARAAERGNSWKDARAAAEQLETAVLLRPDVAVAWIDLARTELVLHDSDDALHALDRAQYLAPRDPEVHLLRGHALLDAILAEIDEAEARSIKGDWEATGDAQRAFRQLSDRLTPAEEAYRAALELAAPEGPLVEEIRLGLARTVLHRARAQDRFAESAPLGLLDEELSGLLNMARVHDLENARSALRDAYAQDDGAVEVAYRHLAEMARGVTLGELNAMRLKAYAGSAPCGEAFLGIVGDLSVHAVLHARKGERARPRDPGRARRLLGEARDRAAWLTLPRLVLAGLAEEASPEYLARLAELVVEAPEFAEWLLELVRERGLTPDRWAGPDDLDHPLGPALLVAAGWPDNPTSPDLRNARRQLARRAYLRARSWLEEHPTAAGGLFLRARTLAALVHLDLSDDELSGPAPAGELRAEHPLAEGLRADLRRARAAAPWAAPVRLDLVRWGRLGQQELFARVDELLAMGYTANVELVEEAAPTVRLPDGLKPLLKRFDVEKRRRDAWEALALDNFPVLAATLRIFDAVTVTRGKDDDYAGFAKLLTNLESRLEGAWIDQARAEFIAQQRSANQGTRQSKARLAKAVAPALRGLRYATPAGRLLSLTPEDWRATGMMPLLLTEQERQRTARSLPHQRGFWELGNRLQRSAATAHLLVSLKANLTSLSAEKPFQRLFEPWTASRALLAAPQIGIDDRLLSFLLAAKAYSEAALDLDRLFGFLRVRPPDEARPFLITNTWRPMACRTSDSEQAVASLRVAYVAAVRTLGYLEHPTQAQGTAADLALDIAARLPEGEERRGWLRRAGEHLATPIPDWTLPSYENEGLLHWRQVRYQCALGKAEAAKRALRQLARVQPNELRPWVSLWVLVRHDPWRSVVLEVLKQKNQDPEDTLDYHGFMRQYYEVGEHYLRKRR